MASEETAIEVTDFEFHALRKVRLSSAPITGDTGKRLAISSSLGLGIAIIADNRLLSYNTSDVHAQRADKTNINEEVTGLRTRITSYFDEKASLVAVACNCDGTLVGVLANTAAGPMVHVFDAAAFSIDYQGHISPITGIRLTADAGAAARCFEWSPAAADTLVAAASDRSLMTVVVKGDSTSYSVLCEKKLGSAVRTISWSRKGKQLVVGDDVGKVIQMKPELDVVRSTMPPDSCTIPNPAVVGLCWMTTTEFLVVHGSSAAGGEKNVQATIMITKKDKPITWTEMPDLNYGSPHSPLTPFMNTLCLLDWNMILATNTKTPEVTMVGKAAEAWQVWIPDEMWQAALPTSAASAETYPVGAELDFSASEQIVLSDDGQKRAPPCPILSILTTDGVLMSYHAVSLKQGATSLQVPRKPINLAAIRVGPRASGGVTVDAAAAAPVAPAAAAPAAAAPVAATTTPKVTSLFGTPTTSGAATSSLFGGAAAAVPAAPAAAATPSLFAALEKAPICSPNLKPAGTPAAAGSLFGAAASAAPAAAATAPPAVPVPDAAVAAAAAAAAAAKEAAAKAQEEAAKHQKLVEERKKVNVLLQEVQNEATALVDEMARMTAITEEVRPTFQDAERELKVEDPKRMCGLDGYVKELEDTERRLERTLKAATIRIADRVKMVEDASCEGGGTLAILRKDYDYDREESMAQIQRRVAAARTTLAETQKELQRLRKPQNERGFESDSKWTAEREERVNMTIKNIQKVVKCEREKVEDVEALVRNVMALKLSDDTARKTKEGFEKHEKAEGIKVVTVKRVQPAKSASVFSSSSSKERTPEERAAARTRLLNAKTLFPHGKPRVFVSKEALDGKKEETKFTLPPSTANSSHLMGGSSRDQTTVVVHSPLRAQLEERLLEVTKPRKALQLPNLEKFSIRQESRPAQLLEPPSPIQPTAAAAAPAAPAAPAAARKFPMLAETSKSPFGEPRATSTPSKPASVMAALAAVKAAAAAEKKGEEKPAAAAAAPPSAPATSSIFGTPTSSGAASSIFGKPAAAAAAPTTATAAATSTTETAAKAPANTTSIFGGSTATPSTPAAADAAAKPTAATSSIFGGGSKNTTTVSFGDAAAPVTTTGSAAAPAAPAAPAAEETAAAAKTEEKKEAAVESPKPATPSIFGGGAATTGTAAATKPATSSIFGGTAASPAAAAATAQPATAAATTSSIFGSKPVSSSIFGGGAAATAASSTTSAAAAATPATSSIFGSPAATTTAASPFGGAAQQKTSSIFGGGTTSASSPFGTTTTSPTTTSAASTSSIFGGGVAQPAAPAAAPANSSFGSFGQPAASGGAASFSFKNAAAAAASEPTQQKSSIFGGGVSSFGQPAQQQQSSIFGGGGQAAAPAAIGSTFGSIFGGGAKPAGSFAAAAAAAAADDGMEDGATAAASSGFGSFGLGSTTSANAGKNVFGGGFGGAAAAPSTQASSIFGKSTSTFGSKPAFGGGSSAFGSSAFGSSSPSSSTFGGAAAAAAATSSPSSGFGAKPAFGSGPAFGAKSVFGGGAAVQQQQQQNTNAFGGGGGFASFAGQGGGFGSVAAQPQQQQQTSSIFGGGVSQQAQPTSSIFGGGTKTTINSFSSWR